MDGEREQSPVRPGDIIAGKYLVECLIGSGGVGVVVAARHLQLEERVALKFLLPKAAKNVVDVARFCREAQAASKLKTEHVSRILDTGVLEDGSPYMVMEYLEGQDLHQRLKSHGPPPVQEALEYVLQAGVALAEAHLLGIVHRDIKPSNLFLTTRPDGTPLIKVLDFGIAKASVDVYAGVGPQNLTQTSALLGSPLYMSPEQIRSTKSVDARSDIWSLGIVLYELLCGMTPFDSDSLTGVVAGVIGTAPPPLGMRRADLSPGLVAIVDKCLAKDPADRYQSMAEMAAALELYAPENAKISVVRILRLQGASPRADNPFAKTPTADVSEPPSATARTLRSESSAAPAVKHRPGAKKFVIAAAAITAVFGAAVWYSWHARQGSVPQVSPSSADRAAISAPLEYVPVASLAVDRADEPKDAGSKQDASSGKAEAEVVSSATVAVASKPTPPAPLPVRTRTLSRPAPIKAKPTKDSRAPDDIVDETVDTRR